MYSATVSREITTNNEDVNQPAPVKLRLVITSVAGFSDKGLFVFMIDPNTSNEEWSNVATPTDLENYNLDVPGSGEFVRKDTLELTYENASIAEEKQGEIEARINLLVQDMAALDTYGTASTVTYSSS